MAYYWGKFRNIDTSIDPLGQEYKVVIFTNYDGSTNPYFNPIIEDIPRLGTELTMTSSPFTVSYQNEDGNIYKPYKCSTATVSFLMSNLNLDLFTNKENNILVALLKRDNDIVLNGNTYINRLTNEVVIRKKTYGLFYGFLPSDVDAYCYKVEWIGYATPNTYNQNYTLVEQEFQLECQDAFSTLSYDGLPFNNLVEVRDVKTLINTIIGQLGTYKHIYYTSNLILPDTGDHSAFIKIVQQYRNFIDEDDEPVSKIELIEAIGTFLNVSFIPFKDSVYVVNYEGVAGNFNYFYNYTITNNNNLFFNYRTENPEWSSSVLECLENNLDLVKDCYAGNDTNITMQSVYNNFRVKCDETEYKLMPDISNSKNYSRLVNNNNSQFLYSESFTSPIYSTGAGWISGVIGELQKVDGIGFTSYIYPASYLDNNNYPQDNDTPTYPPLTPSIFLAKYNSIDNLTHYTGCVVLKNTKIHGYENKGVGSWFINKEDSHLYDSCFGNEIVFWGTNRFEWANVANSSYNTWWNDNDMVALTYKSPKIIARRNKNLCIKGDWTFFRNNAFISLPITDNNGLTVDRSHLYITAEITINISDGTNFYNYCVRKNNDDSLYLFEYNPSLNLPKRVDLPLEDNDYDENTPFGQVFSFKNNLGEKSGLCIPLDKIFIDHSGDVGSELIMDVKVKIMRPFGVAKNGSTPFFANSSILKNYEISLTEPNKIETWGYGDITTDFHNKLNKNLETFEIDNKLSTNQYINKQAYNYSFKVHGGKYYLLNNLNNISTGIIGRPEILKLSDIYNQYKDKTIGLNTTIWENLGITPNTRVMWNNRYFIIDRQEIDYELNRNTITLIEKKLSGEIPELETKMYLENENGQTLNINPFYDETFYPQTVVSYSRNNSAVMGYYSTSINSVISFYPTWTNGIFANVSIPQSLNNISVSINNNGELIITN